MRSVRLAQIVAEAELLRLRQMAGRMAVSVALIAVALIFVVAALAMGHVALYLITEPRFGTLNAVLYLLAGDGVIAALLVGAVVLNRPGRVERQALEVRQTARVQLIQSLTFTAMLGSIARAIGTRQVISLARDMMEMLAKRTK
jgi:hypothetical protein